MIRYGKITELDAAKGLARVKFEDDDIVSDWLQIVSKNSKSTKTESWFDVDEFVACAMDEHNEEGVIVGALYHEGNEPPIGDKDTVGVTFPDGTTISYNRSSHTLNVNCTGNGIVNINCKTASVTAAESVTVDTPTATFTGNVSVDGVLSASGLTSSGDVEADGDIKTDGSVKAIGDVVANNSTPLTAVHLTTHAHPIAAPGSTSPPTPGT